MKPLGGRGRKAPIGGVSDIPEDHMRLITHFELATKTKSELHTLLKQAFNALSLSSQDGHERRNALACIQNIQRELITRISQEP